MSDQPAYETIAQAAERVGVCSKTIRRRIAEGRLTGYRFGPSLIRLDPAEVDALMRPIPTADMGGYLPPGMVAVNNSGAAEAVL